jgi:hypothetical protein
MHRLAAWTNWRSSREERPPKAVDNCAVRFGVRAVKAVSRAQRGRSNAERLDRANANRTIRPDGR